MLHAHDGLFHIVCAELDLNNKPTVQRCSTNVKAWNEASFLRSRLEVGSSHRVIYIHSVQPISACVDQNVEQSSTLIS